MNTINAINLNNQHNANGEKNSLPKDNFMNYNMNNLSEQFSNHLQKAGETYKQKAHSSSYMFNYGSDYNIKNKQENQKSSTEFNNENPIPTDFPESRNNMINDSNKQNELYNRQEYEVNKNQTGYNNKNFNDEVDKIKNKIDAINNEKKSNSTEKETSKDAKKIDKAKLTKEKDKTNKAESENKQKTSNDWQVLVHLLQKLLDKLDKNGDGTKSEWRKPINYLAKLGNQLGNQSKNTLLSELKTLFKNLNDLLSKLKGNQADNITNNQQKAINTKSLIKDILAELQSLFEKKLEENKNPNNQIHSSKLTKINQEVLPQQGIQIARVKDKPKVSNAKEQNVKEVNELDNLNIKNDIKISNKQEANNSNSGFGFSQEKSGIQSQTLKLPKGFNLKNPSELFNQIVNKATMVLNNRRSEMNIKLDPQFLGNIRLKVVVEGKDVSGSFLVDNQLVKNFLEENMNSLKTSLEAQGLRFDEINIFMDDPSKKAFDFHQNSRLLHKSVKNGTRIHNQSLLGEEALISQYITPDWLAKSVDLVI